LPLRSIVFCAFPTEGMGLQATRTTMSSPLVMPPRTPPALFVANPFGVRGSLCLDPVILAASKPEPTSTPLTVPTPIRAFARSASILSNTGSPSPGGHPFTTISTIPPRVSPSLRASSSNFSILSAAFPSGQSRGFSAMSPGGAFSAATPPTSFVNASTEIPSRETIFFATAPAATRAAVSRPEARPPPRWSRMPYFLK